MYGDRPALKSLAFPGHDFAIDLTRLQLGTTTGDSIIGGEQQDVILALGGDDTVSGLGGADYIEGGEGDDQIFGGSVLLATPNAYLYKL